MSDEQGPNERAEQARRAWDMAPEQRPSQPGRAGPPSAAQPGPNSTAPTVPLTPGATGESGYGAAWPPAQSGTPGQTTLSAPPKKSKRGLVITLAIIGVIVLVGGVFGGVTLANYNGAKGEYDDAYDAAFNAHNTLMTASTDYSSAYLAASTSSDMAKEVAPTLSTELIPKEANDAFGGALATLPNALSMGEQNVPDVPPFDPQGGVDELKRDAVKLRDVAKDFTKDEAALADKTQELTDVQSALDAAAALAWKGAPTTAAETVKKYPSATADLKTAFTEAATSLSSAAPTFTPDAESLYMDYANAYTDMVDSHNAVVAQQQQASDLAATKTAIENWARSFAPGISIEFTWADVVNDRGSFNDNIGGYTNWQWYSDGSGWAKIQLSNSVAEWWGTAREANAQAMIVHEVGHAITVRCHDMYDQSNQQSVEAWATAFALSRGYTQDGNGVSLYGMPPQSLIDTAKQCQ